MLNDPNWWDELELVYDYDIETLQKAVLIWKDERSDKKILSDESYDFVVFIGAYPW
jgi:hypothetical protein